MFPYQIVYLPVPRGDGGLSFQLFILLVSCAGAGKHNDKHKNILPHLSMDGNFQFTEHDISAFF